jgi:exosome complex RNA-binding protein Csl4
MTSWDDALQDMGDDDLLAELRAAVAEADLVTDRQREAAQAAFTWRTVDQELAELLHDSALEVTGVRGADDAARTLSFASGSLTLEVEIDGDVVLGQVVGASAQSVVLQRSISDDQPLAVDSAGFFRLDGVGPGPIRFVVQAGDWTLTSPWVAI